MSAGTKLPEGFEFGTTEDQKQWHIGQYANKIQNGAGIQKLDAPGAFMIGVFENGRIVNGVYQRLKTVH